MLQKIKIKDFQSHKLTQLDLHPNVNVIVGRSSSGKTAIFRALQWLVYNRPLGTRFIRHGQEQSEVFIDFDKDGIVKGFKTKDGKTKYEIGWFGFPNDKEEFSSGNSVPDKVSQTLNINEINIQNQLDEHFLITSSPGEVARVFNRIVNIEKADEYISELTTQINSQNKKIADLKEQIEDYKTKLEALNYIENLEAIVSNLEEKEAIVEALKASREGLEQQKVLFKDLSKRQRALWKQENILKKIIQFTEDKLDEIGRLDILCIKIEDYIIAEAKREDLVEKKEVIQKYLNKLEPMLNIYDTIVFNKVGLVEKCHRISTFRYDNRNLIDYKMELSEKINKTIDEYGDELLKVKTCPTCKSNITTKMVNDLVEKLNEDYK